LKNGAAAFLNPALDVSIGLCCWPATRVSVPSAKSRYDATITTLCFAVRAAPNTLNKSSLFKRRRTFGRPQTRRTTTRRTSRTGRNAETAVRTGREKRRRPVERVRDRSVGLWCARRDHAGTAAMYAYIRARRVSRSRRGG